MKSGTGLWLVGVALFIASVHSQALNSTYYGVIEYDSTSSCSGAVRAATIIRQEETPTSAFGQMALCHANGSVSYYDCAEAQDNGTTVTVCSVVWTKSKLDMEICNRPMGVFNRPSRWFCGNFTELLGVIEQRKYLALVSYSSCSNTTVANMTSGDFATLTLVHAQCHIAPTGHYAYAKHLTANDTINVYSCAENCEYDCQVVHTVPFQSDCAISNATNSFEWFGCGGTSGLDCASSVAPSLGAFSLFSALFLVATSFILLS